MKFIQKILKTGPQVTTAIKFSSWSWAVLQQGKMLQDQCLEALAFWQRLGTQYLTRPQHLSINPKIQQVLVQ